jgi:hypothetical protein
MTTIHNRTTSSTRPANRPSSVGTESVPDRIVIGAELTVIPISDREWRVSDPTRRNDDALCLIGFIERIADLYETTRIGAPRERRQFPTLSAALAHLAERPNP